MAVSESIAGGERLQTHGKRVPSCVCTRPLYTCTMSCRSFVTADAFSHLRRHRWRTPNAIESCFSSLDLHYTTHHSHNGRCRLRAPRNNVSHVARCSNQQLNAPCIGCAPSSAELLPEGFLKSRSPGPPRGYGRQEHLNTTMSVECCNTLKHFTVTREACPAVSRHSGGLRMHRYELLTRSMPGALRLPSPTCLTSTCLTMGGRRTQEAVRSLTSTPPSSFFPQPHLQPCCSASLVQASQHRDHLHSSLQLTVSVCCTF